MAFRRKRKTNTTDKQPETERKQMLVEEKVKRGKEARPTYEEYEKKAEEVEKQVRAIGDKYTKPKEEEVFDVLPVKEEKVEEVKEAVKPREMAPIYTMGDTRTIEEPLKGPLSMIDLSDIGRKHFTNKVLNENQYTADDLMFIFDNANKNYTILRANKSPGTEAKTALALEKLNELRAVLKRIGFSV